jgi:hypothetical protein
MHGPYMSEVSSSGSTRVPASVVASVVASVPASADVTAPMAPKTVKIAKPQAAKTPAKPQAAKSHVQQRRPLRPSEAAFLYVVNDMLRVSHGRVTRETLLPFARKLDIMGPAHAAKVLRDVMRCPGWLDNPSAVLARTIDERMPVATT